MQLRSALFIAALISALLTAGCTYHSGFGFPVEDGDIRAGQQAFIDHRCHACHSVAGVRLPDLPGASTLTFELGGETSQVKSYSGLVSSLMNPDHVISEQYLERQQQPLPPRLSPMPTSHVETMTVRELIDIVVFLDSRYVLIDKYDTDR